MMDLLSWPFKPSHNNDNGDPAGHQHPQVLGFCWPWSDQQQQQYARDLAVLEAAALHYYWNPATLAHWVSSASTATTSVPEESNIKTHHPALSFGIDRILGDQVGGRIRSASKDLNLSSSMDEDVVLVDHQQNEDQKSNQQTSGEISVTNGNSRRKRSWSRAVFSNLQRKGLEKRFQLQKYITKPDRRQLAATLGLTDAQVKVWFQNRRMKWRHTKERLVPGVSGSGEDLSMIPSSPITDDISYVDDNLSMKFD